MTKKGTRQKRKRKLSEKTREDVKNELVKSIISQKEAASDYTQLTHENPALKSVESCITQYDLYEKAAKKNKNNIILFSIYQGKVIKQLKDHTKIDRKQYEKILKD